MIWKMRVQKDAKTVQGLENKYGLKTVDEHSIHAFDVIYYIYLVLLEYG